MWDALDQWGDSATVAQQARRPNKRGEDHANFFNMHCVIGGIRG